MGKASKTTLRDASTGKFDSSYKAIRNAMKELRKNGVAFEISPNGSLRVNSASYQTYIKSKKPASS